MQLIKVVYKNSVCYYFLGQPVPNLLYCNTAGSPCFSITLVHTGVLGSATPDQDSRILAARFEFCSGLNKRSDNTSDVTCAERWIIGFEDGIPFSPWLQSKVQLNELAKIHSALTKGRASVKRFLTICCCRCNGLILVYIVPRQRSFNWFVTLLLTITSTSSQATFIVVM